MSHFIVIVFTPALFFKSRCGFYLALLSAVRAKRLFFFEAVCPCVPLADQPPAIWPIYYWYALTSSAESLCTLLK